MGTAVPQRGQQCRSGAAGSWSTPLSLPSQYLAFFEFNSRLEAILSKAYIYRCGEGGRGLPRAPRGEGSPWAAPALWVPPSLDGLT